MNTTAELGIDMAELRATFGEKESESKSPLSTVYTHTLWPRGEFSLNIQVGILDRYPMKWQDGVQFGSEHCAYCTFFWLLLGCLGSLANTGIYSLV